MKLVILLFSLFSILLCIEGNSYAECRGRFPSVSFTCNGLENISGEFPLTRRDIPYCDPENKIYYAGGVFLTAPSGLRFSSMIWASDASHRARKGVINIVVASDGRGNFGPNGAADIASFEAVEDCRGLMIENGKPFNIVFGKNNTDDSQLNCTYSVCLP